jgi:hypothetical protein
MRAVRSFLPAAPAVLGLAFAVHAAAGLWYTGRLRVSGDEPHYLVMAQSLWREHDLDLRDNYEREDWREHTPGPLRPHYAAPRADGRPFPAHSVGLPLLLAAPYAAAGRPGTVVVLAALSAVAVAFAVALGRRLGAPSPRPVAAIAAGPPLFFFGFHVYTEGASAACVAAAAWALLAPPAVGTAALAALAAVALPWLHLKMALAAACIGILGLLRFRGRALAVFLAVAAAGAVAFGAHHARVFGTPNPLAVYGGVPQDMAGQPWRAVLGLLLDRSFGLLPWAPVFLVGLAGLPDLARRGRDGRLLLALMAAVVLPVLGWRMWWGGQSPPARFLVPALPLLAVAAALRIEGQRGFLWRAWPWLAALGWLIALRVIVSPGELLLLNRGDRPTRLWESLGLNAVMPSFVSVDGAAIAWTVAWGGGGGGGRPAPRRLESQA